MFVPTPPPNLGDEELERHPSWRRKTRKYRKKRQIVRDLWILSGLLMLSAPLGLMLVLGIGTTFLSFVILDETQ